MKYCDTPVPCAIAAAVLAAACRLHGEVVCPDKDRDGEVDGVVSFHCHTEPYFFMLDEADDPWRVELADERNVPPLFPGCRVKVRGIFPKWSATPRLRTATVEMTGRENAPPYLEMTPAELYAMDSDGEPGRRLWYGRLVSTSGVILDINRRETYTQLLIGPKETSVQVSVPFRLTSPLPPDFRIGAHIRVRGVGVYTAVRDEKRNVATSIKDIQVRAATMKDVWLRVEVRQGETPPKGLCGAAMCRFAYSLDGTCWRYAPNHFTAREGKWIGATVGIYALSPHSCRDRGWIDADWFRIDR